MILLYIYLLSVAASERKWKSAQRDANTGCS